VIRAPVPGHRIVGTFLLAAALAACQPGASTQAPGVSGGTTATNTLQPPGSVGPPPSPTPPPETSPVILDPDLLTILPESIDGFPITEAIDEAAIALADPALPRIAAALDVGVAVDPATANLVSAHVVRLRPEAFTEDTFRQWRDSFDEGACAAAGGVGGHAEATIDDRRTFITNCAAGLHTYHVWLAEQDILISASSIGEGRFGERLMDNLRVPE
jgi:hypothetical protein